VQTCPSCGDENADRARFCQQCGSPLGQTAAGEVRKSVTVLFCDIVGSTQLAEHLDPEALTRVMRGHFERMRAVIERHGGTVAKFIGDAVLGVFGVPQSHEDDVLRAVRAADEARRELQSLNEELAERWGVRLETRTGINTGEVLVGAFGLGEGIAIGDAMNLGARLEQHADPGDILLGEASYGLVRHAVEAEPLEPFPVKGKAVPVRAFRLLRVMPSVEPLRRRLDAPLVGRKHELSVLEMTFRTAVGERRCRLAAVMGEPGVGKTRLVGELLDQLAPEAEVLRGRCLSYGEGITFWPVAEIVRQATGIPDDEPPDVGLVAIRSLLGEEPDADGIAARVAAAVGLISGTYAIQETFWAVRKLLEAMALRRPLVVLIDDIHWAEPTLFDLIDHVVQLTADAPILLLCTARPEVAERRLGWPPDETVVVRLEPLSDQEVDRLMTGLLGSIEMETKIRLKVVQTADGNPLFVEQVVSMLIDEGLLVREDGYWVGRGDLSTVPVPTTISALLETRLGRLDPIERSTLERAAVVGKVFSHSSVAALLPDELRPQVGVTLLSLERKEFVRPDLSRFLGEQALAFRHALIRDAAYQGMLKRTRAELHERFADWLEATASERLSEYGEILGHHLEQAYRHRAALGPVDKEGRALAGRAATWLIPAARKASARGDVAARVNLFGRAEELLDREDPRHSEVRFELALAVSASGGVERAEALLDEIAEEARARGDRALEVRSRIHWMDLRALTHPAETSYASLLAEGEAAVAVFTELGDAGGLASAWAAIARAHYLWSHHGPRLDACQRALEYAMRAGDLALASGCVGSIAFAMLHGPTPANTAVRKSQELLARFSGRPVFELAIKTPMCVSLAMLGRLPEARDATARAMNIAGDLGATWSMATAVWMAGEVERLAGEWESAERMYRRAYETYVRMGEKAQFSTLAVLLGNAAYAQGRHEDAFELTQESEAAASREDFLSQMLWRALRAKVLCGRGATSEAESLGRDAMEVGRKTDSIDMQGDVAMDLSEVLGRAGRALEAREAIEEALSLYERKGNLVSAARARAALAHL
jgi:class 3 adenylate cyclase/tetratricopeptide (TPR) repeat protein